MSITPQPPMLDPAFQSQLLYAVQQHAEATLAAAIIAASGRPNSVDEAIQIMRDIHWSLHPTTQNGRYTEWQKTKDTAKVHA